MLERVTGYTKRPGAAGPVGRHDRQGIAIVKIAAESGGLKKTGSDRNATTIR